MSEFDWDDEKNLFLERTRGIGFEDVVFHIQNGDVSRLVAPPVCGRLRLTRHCKKGESMPFTVKVVDELGIIELRFEGAVDAQQLSQTRAEVRRLIQEQSRNALVDMRDMDFAMSTFDIFSFASTIQHPPSYRIALLCRSQDNDARFFENVARNRGIPITLFSDHDKALQFLRRTGSAYLAH